MVGEITRFEDLFLEIGRLEDKNRFFIRKSVSFQEAEESLEILKAELEALQTKLKELEAYCEEQITTCKYANQRGMKIQLKQILEKLRS